MAGKRSPELLAIPLVAAAVVWFGVLFWAVIAMTTVSWVVFAVVNVAMVAGVFVLILKRRRAHFPSSRERAVPPSDGVYRLLVLADGGAAAAAIREQLADAAGGKRAEAFVIAPTVASRVDWLTGDQAVYDRAAGELDETLAALESVGIDARGRVGAADPVQAAADGLREFPADAIVLVTRSDGSSWLEAGVLETLRSRAGLPVRHVAVERV